MSNVVPMRTQPPQNPMPPEMVEFLGRISPGERDKLLSFQLDIRRIEIEHGKAVLSQQEYMLGLQVKYRSAGSTEE